MLQTIGGVIKFIKLPIPAIFDCNYKPFLLIISFYDVEFRTPHSIPPSGYDMTNEY